MCSSDLSLSAKRVEAHRASNATVTPEALHERYKSATREEKRREENLKTERETHARTREAVPAVDQHPSSISAGSSVVSDLDAPQEQIIVPERMQHPDVMAAARRWFRHLQQKDPGRVPLPSSPQLQEWWQRAGRLGPQRFLEAVSFSVSRGYLNLVEEDRKSTRLNSSH